MEDKWIKPSDQLPEPWSYVLATIESPVDKWVEIVHIDDKGHWLLYGRPRTTFVIAWMKLPEPAKKIIMKEIPMLFSTAMVQAELDGRKTMTRRLKGLELVNANPGKWSLVEVDSPFKPADIFWFEGHGERVAIKCPYSQAGDLLWVRETWRGIKQDFGPDRIEYKATETVNLADKWRPSIHMPKEAARIWLQVTNVCVERLQDISEEDAKAEGVKPAHCETNDGCPSLNCKDQCCEIGNWWNYRAPDGEGFPAFTAKSSFESLWESINGRESLDANPWVWVISFKVLSTTGKPLTTTP